MKHSVTQRILVAGGGGFLGIHLCKSLLKDGHDVICLDNFSSSSKHHLELVSAFKNFTVLEQDVAEPLDISVDEIYNMTALPLSVQYQADPLQAMRTSAEGINNLLKLAVAKQARVFQSSSREVCEKAYSAGTAAVDGERCAETLCLDYQRMYSVDVKIARLFNTYGPHMRTDDGRLLSGFIIQALLNRPITLYGNGSRIHSLCYVDEMIADIKSMMASPATGPANIGHPIEFTELELATTVVELTGSASPIQFHPIHQHTFVEQHPQPDGVRQRMNLQTQMLFEKRLLNTMATIEQQFSNPAMLARVRANALHSFRPRRSMEF